jgi:ubiquinone/menaquinone biosynthesis C-methylase UbiE
VSHFALARQTQEELLDQGVGSPADVRENLTEMWQLNQRLGGVSALTRHLFPLLARTRDPQHVVDLGTGSGELALHVAGWARAKQLDVKMWLLDVSARNLAVAQANANGSASCRLLQANMDALPFAPKCVDYYMSSLVLHHLPPEAVVALLRETYRQARRGIVMSDLVRGYLPLAAFRLVQPVLVRNYLTRHDGALSIRRAYLPRELLALAHEAGLASARVYSHFPWRMTLVAEKPHG